MRAIALVPLLIALTPRGPHGPIGDRKALKRQVGEQLWLRHVVKPGEHQWARGANVLAGRGKQGTRTQVEHMRR